VKSIIDTTYGRVCEAHFSIMHQLVVMRPYVEKHLQELHEKNQDEDLIMKQYKLHFTTLLEDLNLPVRKIEEEKMIHLLTSGPHSLVKSWRSYDIDGCTFYSKAKDSRSQCQNSGVRVDVEDSTGKNAFYGYIEEIWLLNDGISLQIPMFKCQWLKHPQGVEIDDYGFAIVDLINVGHKDEKK
jgi:hypothetical protein